MSTQWERDTRPAEVLRDAAVRFMCESSDLPSLVGASEFASFSEELVPRIHEAVHARLVGMRNAASFGSASPEIKAARAAAGWT